MKNYVIIGVITLVLVVSIFVLGNKKGGQNPTGNQDAATVEVKKPGDIFKDMTDLCNVLTKEQVSELSGKQVIKTVPLTSGTLHSCQYYLNDSQAIVINNDLLNVENQKKGHEFLGRKIITNPKIPMENFFVIQEDGLINEIYLVLGPNNYVSINRTSSKTLTEDEMISFAIKLAEVVIGKTPLTKSETPPSPTAKAIVPLPQETDIVRNFFNLIAEKRASDAVSMMSVTDDSAKQAWAVQFNAITSMKVLTIEPSMPNDWTDTKHTYKVTLDVSMNPTSANAPIPYYGWENGQNIRWVSLENVGNLWKIQGIATGP